MSSSGNILLSWALGVSVMGAASCGMKKCDEANVQRVEDNIAASQIATDQIDCSGLSLAQMLNGATARFMQRHPQEGWISTLNRTDGILWILSPRPTPLCRETSLNEQSCHIPFPLVDAGAGTIHTNTLERPRTLEEMSDLERQLYILTREVLGYGELSLNGNGGLTPRDRACFKAVNGQLVLQFSTSQHQP